MFGAVTKVANKKKKNSILVIVARPPSINLEFLEEVSDPKKIFFSLSNIYYLMTRAVIFAIYLSFHCHLHRNQQNG